MRWPSGENATEWAQLLCPSKGPETTAPVSAFQTRIVRSSEPDTMRLPSGENTTEPTEWACPTKIYIRAGQFIALPVWMESIRGNLGRYCFDTADTAGANGRADR